MKESEYWQNKADMDAEHHAARMEKLKKEIEFLKENHESNKKNHQSYLKSQEKYRKGIKHLSNEIQ